MDALATAFGREVHDQTAAVLVDPLQLQTAVLQRSLEPGQYLSIRYTERLAEVGAVNSVGSRGDSYDNALAEAVNGLYKAEVIHKSSPWRSLDQVEFATANWVDWWNHKRLHSSIGSLPPEEFEASYYRRLQAAVAA